MKIFIFLRSLNLSGQIAGTYLTILAVQHTTRRRLVLLQFMK
jgi:hypothetical protein